MHSLASNHSATETALAGASRLALPWRNLRLLAMFLVQAMLVAVAVVMAVQIRFDFDIPRNWRTVLAPRLPIYVLVQLLCCWYAGVLQGLWRYVSVHDAWSLLKATSGAALLVAGYDYVSGPEAWMPGRVHVMAWLLSYLGLLGARVAVRLARLGLRSGQPGGQPRRVLLLGAGDAAFRLARELLESRTQRCQVLGFLDDDLSKAKQTILGLPILGPMSDLIAVHRAHGLDEVIVAIRKTPGDFLRQVSEICAREGIALRVLPEASKLRVQGAARDTLRPLALEDLLRRPAVELDEESIGGLIRGSRVLVTGAAGSIGSEICREVARYSPSKLVVCDQAESPLVELHAELQAACSGLALVPELASACNASSMRRIFAGGIDVVLHAAAYKHVPLLENHAAAAVANNVGATLVLAELASEHRTRTFVLISSDKAVMPSSIMGCTKRVCELLILWFAQAHPATRFSTVRFGNVLGSSGSVVPLFRKQLAAGGPITVTHPEVKRYFMTIPEASQLVLQAATMGETGALHLLEMGEPILIVDLARDLIRLSGRSDGDEIPVTFTGLRPGEKLEETLTMDFETSAPTAHPSIRIVRQPHPPAGDLMERVRRLLASAQEKDEAAVLAMLRDLVPEYSAR